MPHSYTKRWNREPNELAHTMIEKCQVKAHQKSSWACNPEYSNKWMFSLTTVKAVPFCMQ